MLAGKIVHRYVVSCGGRGKQFTGKDNFPCRENKECDGSKKSCEAVFRTIGWKYTSKYGWLCPDCADMYAKLKEQKTIGKLLRHGNS